MKKLLENYKKITESVPGSLIELMRIQFTPIFDAILYFNGNALFFGLRGQKHTFSLVTNYPLWGLFLYIF